MTLNAELNMICSLKVVGEALMQLVELAIVNMPINLQDLYLFIRNLVLNRHVSLN